MQQQSFTNRSQHHPGRTRSRMTSSCEPFNLRIDFKLQDTAYDPFVPVRLASPVTSKPQNKQIER